MDTLSETICRITGASSVELGEEIQGLWSGYGVIQRATLRRPPSAAGVERMPVVIKHIDISRVRCNRRGWGGDVSHLRKVRSYQVEKAFYETFSQQCDASCLVPGLIAAHEKENAGGWIIVLDDLDAQGFDRRKDHVDEQSIHACLSWLANFHATFMGTSATGLWPIGTYWHLETRPDELASMRAGPLKQSAHAIDSRLNAAKYQTLVHGDAKVANFCFSDRDRDRVAAVDFQYVGRGCGMKDVAYFISSCLSEQEAASRQDSLLGFYFGRLEEALSARGIAIDFAALQNEWLELYLFAWADFCRFLSGWSPGHWKLNAYSDGITQSVLVQLGRS
ncbi:Phosphotransferase enzyme family protein [Allorhodopirellula solitaria]|uniref:Phosphotransferase enzyme family protein n=1 Tax=Allorhodopirellula solitaria TaxID=2527987 RepID=A0A5C5WPA5_9BACT|nr:Phosphotransferase enzyme family protein [Allorhodopirellula solitaria]